MWQTFSILNVYLNEEWVDEVGQGHSLWSLSVWC